MGEYVARRLLWFFPVLLLGATVVFITLYIIPGNAAHAILGGGGGLGFSYSAEQLAELEAKLGLNRPLYVQYLSWLWGALHLDFGNSLWTGYPVIKEIGLRAPISFTLIAFTLVISVLVAIPIGVISALRQDSWVDYVARSIAISGLSVPGFVLGIFIILGLILTFRWSVPLDYAPIYKAPLISLQQLIFPALVLSFRTMAIEARMMRSCMLEVIREDYIRTARAKGLAARAVLWGHALPNAILPVITTFAVEMVIIFSGAVIIENLFQVPGVGSFLADALERRDIPVVQGILLLILGYVMILNLIVDLVYAWIDPRVRYR